MLGEELKRSAVAAGPLVYLVDDDADLREEMLLGLTRLGLDVHGFDSAAALYRGAGRSILPRAGRVLLVGVLALLLIAAVAIIVLVYRYASLKSQLPE